MRRQSTKLEPATASPNELRFAHPFGDFLKKSKASLYHQKVFFFNKNLLIFDYINSQKYVPNERFLFIFLISRRMI
jgi:hypothetical protein